VARKPGGNPRTGSRWLRFRRQVLEHYGPWCWLGQDCCLGDPHIDLALPWTLPPHDGYFTVHHLRPIAHGGALLDMDNAVPAHWLCNARQGDRPPEATGRTHARW
jgi:hypothetical protein